MRIAWLALAIGAIGCGIAGIVLPLVPTTPLLLVAAYAFARSSPTLHDWLVTHPRFGPVIADWRMHGAIERRTKFLAVTVMFLMPPGSWIAGLGISLLLLQASVLAAAAVFILTRPDAPAGRCLPCWSDLGSHLRSEHGPSRSLSKPLERQGAE